jgi:hypothetical protein
LKQVKHRTFDVLGPDIVINIEADLFDEPINIVELEGELELVELFAFDFFSLDKFEWMNAVGVLDHASIGSTDTDVVQTKRSQTITVEVKAGLGLDTSESLLVGNFGNSSSDLGIETIAIFLASFEGWEFSWVGEAITEFVG